ncbi:KAP family P-loop NTPase fold protein [Microbacterium enclense]|uniref:KAP family P-loop NTPase fold protein n=1 Tax=Microbacterium enclense TaxID=993073 RepID=UPI003F7FC80D
MSKSRNQAASETAPFADDALTDDAEDTLGRGDFVESIVALLSRLRQQANSTVIGVVGPWGLGKSSVLNAVMKRMGERDAGRAPWVVAEFNPWYYQDVASLQLAFFRELSAALPDGSTWTADLREGLASFVDALAPLGALGSLAGVDGSGILKHAADLTRGGQGVLEAKAAVERALLKAERPVLVVIDDVDRLDPQELLLLFKLIRLAGRLPHVYYLLAYDEDTLVDALGRTGLIGDSSPRRALDYMEKIVQVRVDVPPVRERQLHAWVDAEIEELAKGLRVQMDPTQNQRFTQAYFGHIRERLRTPRAIKRFFAQVQAMAVGLSEEVDFVDFLVVTWIRSAEPLLYRAIIEHRAVLLGELEQVNTSITAQAASFVDKTHWATVFKRARVDSTDLNGVVFLMGYLFPRFALQWESDVGTVSAPPHGRVAHPDYFDRFFAFGVPADDISDRMVETACAQILAGQDGQERTTLESLWADKPSLVVDKLKRYWRPGSVDSVVCLRWLAKHAAELPADDFSPTHPRRQAVHFAQVLFASSRESNAVNAVRAMMQADPSLVFADDVLYILRDGAAPPETRNAHFRRALEELAEGVGKVFDSFDGTNPLDYPDNVWERFQVWQVVDPDAVHAWATKHLDAGDWPLLDLLARMVSRTVPIGVVGGESMVGDLNLGQVDAVVGLDRAVTELADEIKSVGPLRPRRAPASVENRRKVALLALRASALSSSS